MLWQQHLLLLQPVVVVVALLQPVLLVVLVSVLLQNSWRCCCSSSWRGWLNCSGLLSCLPTNRVLLLLPQEQVRQQLATVAVAVMGRAAVCMMLLQVV